MWVPTWAFSFADSFVSSLVPIDELQSAAKDFWASVKGVAEARQTTSVSSRTRCFACTARAERSPGGTGEHQKLMVEDTTTVRGAPTVR